MAICGLLSPKDQRSLAETCRRLFSIVHLSPPPTVVKIDNWKVISTGSKSKDRLHLRWATEVHWQSWPQWGWSWQIRAERRRLHAVLSILPTIPYIRLLSLRDVDLNSAQQAIIFGSSTLRTLVVHSCQFHWSTKPPPLSHITTLRLINNSRYTTRYLLTKLAATVETVDFNYLTPDIYYALQEGFIELPKLSTICMGDRLYANRLAFPGPFKRYRSITTLCILFNFDFNELFIDDSDFPALRSLLCPDKLAISLLPKRPVTTFAEFREGPWELLNALSKTSVGITNLKIYVADQFYHLLPCLATSFPVLEQLTIRCGHNGSPWERARSPGDLSWTNTRGVTVFLPKLKRVTIMVNHDRIEPPYTSSAWLREKLFVPFCPALEVFECLCFPIHLLGSDFVLPSELDRGWKTRRLPDGGWEAQGPPPIPFPVRRYCM